MNLKTALKFSFCTLLLSNLCQNTVYSTSNQSPAKVKALSVRGWPLPNPGQLSKSNEPPDWLANDPVLGRMICPPISRLNLTKNSSEGLLFEKVDRSKHGKTGERWTYLLRQGIYWWSGEAVTPLDYEKFLKNALLETIEKKGLGLWKVPSFFVSTKGNSIVQIDWETTPQFGPYFLNGVALSRPRNVAQLKHSIKFECAGVYKPSVSGVNLHLSPTPGYLVKRPPVTFELSGANEGKTSDGRSINFSMAEDFSNDPRIRPPDKPANCLNPIHLPFVSSVVWNPKSAKIQDPQVRKVLTSASPRGAILRAGAGFAGELLSMFIPRTHPGYDSRILVRPFDLSKASAELDRIGFVRPRGDQSRLDPEKKIFSLNLQSLQEEQSIVEKVIADSFISLGIKTRVIKMKANTPVKTDGWITGIHLPWPEMDIAPSFHSKAKRNSALAFIGSSRLDQLLASYSLSLSTEKPDFKILQKIHSELYSLEPAITLLQHKACLIDTKFEGLPKVDTNDPDWFRKIVH